MVLLAVNVSTWLFYYWWKRKYFQGKTANWRDKTVDKCWIFSCFFSRFNSLFNYWKVFLIHINFSNIHQGWLEPEKTLYNMNPCDQRSLQNIKCMKTQVKHWLSFLFRLSCDLHRFVLNMLTRQFFCLKFNRKVFSFKTNRKPVSLEKKKMKKTWGGVFFCSPAWPNYFHLKTDSML